MSRVDAVVSKPAGRFVLVHYHIFKNAGTTMEYILEREFDGHFASLHGPNPDSTLSAADLVDFIRANPAINAVTSHHLRYPKPSCPGVVFFDCCLFRDPIDRLWSMHKYFQRAEPNDDLSRRSKVLDVRAHFEWLIQAHPNVVNDNQVNLLANEGNYTRTIGEDDFNRALAVVKDTALLGVLDLYDESMVAAEYYLYPAFARQYHYIAANVSNTPVSAAEAHERVRELCGQAIYDQLVRLNEYDLRLVEAVRAEVRRRLDKIPNAAERLRDFRARCEALRLAREAHVGSEQP